MNYNFYEKIYKNLIIILLFLIIQNDNIISQEYAFFHLDSENGLPSSSIFHAIQDSKGYIWFATDNGVSKYNGFNFTNYDLNDGLPKNTVLEIFEDYKGRIWFTTMGAKIAYYLNGKIYPFKYNDKISKLQENKQIPLKSSFYVDSLDNVYFGKQYTGITKITKFGDISVYDTTAVKCDYNIAYKMNKNKYIISQISEKRNTEIHFSTGKKIELDKNIALHPIHSFIVPMSKTKLFYSNDFFLYEIENFKEKKHIDFKSHIQWLSKDNGNNIWVCGRKNGATCYKNGNLSDSSKTVYLENYSISSVLQDSEGSYWFTTSHDGVFYLPSKNVYSYTTENGLYNNNVKCIAAQNDNIWIGYNSNYISVMKNGNFKHSKLSELNNSELKVIIYDSINNQIVAGTTYYGYIIKNNKIKKIENNHFSLRKNLPKYFLICDIAQKNKDEYWFGCSYGFQNYKNGIITYKSDYYNKFYLRVNSIYINDDNSIWLGTIDGLWKFENKKLIDYGKFDDRFKIRILDIIKNGTKLILATKGGGILIYENDSIIQITKKNGLSSNTINSLVFTSKDTLWAGSINGLNNIILSDKNKNFKINTFLSSHKLITSEIRQIIPYKNRLILATNKGLVYFNYKNLNNKTIEAPLYIKNVIINNIETQIKSNYKLEHNQNNIKIVFETISFKNAADVEYRIKLNGLDTNWIYTENSDIRFNQLQPGDYKLYIEAISKNNSIKTKAAIINFIIKKSIWQTTFMKLVYIFLIISFFFAIYKYRVNEIKKKLMIEESLNWHKKQALFNQMNPHFLFNSLNSINNYILHNEKKSASKYLNKFAGLIRRILENSQNEYVTLAKEIETNKLYLEIETVRLKDKFVYNFEIDENINTYEYKIPSMLIQPFIENSIWHGIQPLEKQGYITIKAIKNKDTIVISISDNGIGRNNSSQIKKNTNSTHKSLGANIALKRIELLEKSYKKGLSIKYEDLFENNTPSGTAVHITIPIIK
ncbi:MAG: histidine kinase [Bacteroidales bacterium]|nr:histidine kinase [Bacteroidales bacterium]MBN2756381.1 histidine kinase [Bacteroidales bacterium]